MFLDVREDLEYLFFGLQDGEFIEPPHFHPPSQGRGDVGYYFMLDI
jgi:hypothetical protein